jgi:hypothetical protein
MKSWRCQLGALSVVVVCLLLWGCSVNQPESSATNSPAGGGQGNQSAQFSEAIVANAISVQVTGEPNAYQFSVEVSSPDEGCDRYADWWEVFTDDGRLVYRRILDHSHVDEQPFDRSGGPIVIDPDTIVVIRAHMHPGGYGGSVLQGTVRGGFEAVEIDASFAAGLETEPPQPTGCAF